LEQSEQGRIYTLEQIIPMLYPDILQNNFNSLVKESNLLPEQKEKIEMALSIMKSSHKDQFRDE
jgi:N-acyl-L-homoserine lactone synthetase